MSRRRFLQLVAGSSLLAATSCLASAPAVRAGSRRIRAIAFDLFTLFDPRTIDRTAEAIVPGRGAALAETWRTRQFQYAWLHLGAGRYRDFAQLTEDALAYAMRAQGLELAAADRTRLLRAYRTLDPWPDTARVLAALRARGLRLAPLANFTPGMIDELLVHAGLADAFDDRISTDLAHTYKPAPRAYQLAVERFGLARDEIAFAAFGGWDAAGATWFGLPTFWVNRFDVAAEQLVEPVASGPDLEALARWLT